MVVTVHSILDSVFKKVNRNYQISRGMLLAISPGHGSLVIELILKGYVRDCAAWIEMLCKAECAVWLEVFEVATWDHALTSLWAFTTYYWTRNALSHGRNVEAEFFVCKSSVYVWAYVLQIWKQLVEVRTFLTFGNIIDFVQLTRLFWRL